MLHLALFILAPLAAYLLGSIPFAFVIGKAHGVDIRTTGSKNIGATNLGRTLGLRFFFYAFALDTLKGFLPTLAVALITRQTPHAPFFAPLLTAAAAIFGHLYPLYLGFKGGKGIATTFGAVLGVWPLFTLTGLGCLAVFLVVFLGWRYISLASLAAALVFPLLILYFGTLEHPFFHIQTRMDWPDLAPLFIAAIVLSLLVIYKHRANIRRLRAGTEPKLGQHPPTKPL